MTTLTPTRGLLLAHHGFYPKVEQALYIAPNATIVGDVEAGPDTSFWFGCVVRGDVNSVRIGARSNVQDLSMLHVSYRRAALTIGEDVTVGHSCVLHACRIGDRVLVGMGSIVMDNAVIGDDCIIGAGTLVTEGTVIPPGSLVIGRPGAVKRPLTPEEKEFLKRSAAHYTHVARSYTGGPWPYLAEKPLHDAT
jgi:carbonic anhydrase/acetyltransferase-like protein (isoleucine patch superfamily)